MMLHAKVLREPDLEAHGDEDDARVLIVIEEAVYVTVFAYPTFPSIASTSVREAFKRHHK